MYHFRYNVGYQPIWCFSQSVTTTATGISKVENLKVAQDGKCFNLAGQQVGKNYKGIVIKNGKKMVVK